MARPIGTATGARTTAPTSPAATASRMARGRSDRQTARTPEESDGRDRHGDEAVDPAGVDGGREGRSREKEPSGPTGAPVPAGGPGPGRGQRDRQRIRHRDGARLPELTGERGDHRRGDRHRNHGPAAADPSPDRLRGQESRHDRHEGAGDEAHRQPDPAVRPNDERDRRDDHREAWRLLERRDAVAAEECLAQRPEGVVDVAERILPVQAVEAVRGDQDGHGGEHEQTGRDPRECDRRRVRHGSGTSDHPRIILDTFA